MTPAKPACLMVFQDGSGYANPTGTYRVPVVFDNLIAAKEMPVTIGVFIDPGNLPAAQPGGAAAQQSQLRIRFARRPILALPHPGDSAEVTKKYNITKDPEGRAIGGASSGGICAFTGGVGTA
jgi:enterochelin esterase family protein